MSDTLTVDVVDAEGKKTGSADLPADVFDVQTNIPLIHQVVVAQLAAARQGTHDTKISWRGARWWAQAVQAEGHRPRPSGFDACSAVRRWWRRPRPHPA